MSMRQLSVCWLMIGVIASQVQAAEPVLKDLSGLQWQHRVVVINQPKDTKQVLQQLQIHAPQLQERDVIWLVIDGEQVLSNHPQSVGTGLLGQLRQQVTNSPGEVVLIGKDGGIKARYPELQLSAIDASIDAMPMRRQEMGAKANNQ